MKKFITKVTIICSLMVIILGIISSCNSRYELFVTLVVENRTGQTISVFVSTVGTENPAPINIGKVAPNRTRTFKDSTIMPGFFDEYLIEAKSDAGDTIFSKTFTVDELKVTNWKITIR